MSMQKSGVLGRVAEVLNNWSSLRFYFPWWAMLFISLAPHLSAQTTATIAGTVHDKQGLKQQALLAPFVSIDSDAEPMNPVVATYAHPRTFGTFPRVLAKYVREEKVITLENAIREMTSLPANQLKLRNRGHISRGMAADLVLFDPAKITDTATFAKPLSYAVGVDFVLVNGQLAIEGGKPTGTLAGTVIQYHP